MKVKKHLIVIPMLLAMLLPSCDYSHKKIKKEVNFYGCRFIYYKDGSGSLYFENSKWPIYQTPNCSFKEKNLSEIKQGDLLIDIVKMIGFPRFIGYYEYVTLDFGKPDDDIYRLAFETDLTLHRYDIYEYFWASTWCSSRTTGLPSREDTEKITIGMTLDEVVETIGKPQRATLGWPIKYHFDLDDGGVLTTVWNTKNNSRDEKPYYLASMEITEKP